MDISSSYKDEKLNFFLDRSRNNFVAQSFIEES